MLHACFSILGQLYVQRLNIAVDFQSRFSRNAYFTEKRQYVMWPTIYATIRTYWAEALKDQHLIKIYLYSACYGSFNFFSISNSLRRVSWG